MANLRIQVGLAVGDIKSVQDNAALQRLAMQAEMMLDTEKRLPEFLRRKLAVGTKRLYPNREWGAGVVSWMPHFMVRIEDENLLLKGLESFLT